MNIRPIRGKAGKGNGLMIAAVVGIFLLVGVVAIALFGGFGIKQQTLEDIDKPDAPTSAGGYNCASDKDWAGTVNVRNSLNSSGTENYDTTMYFYNLNSDGSRGALFTSITDTSSGAVTLSCGELYQAEIRSTSGAAGDSAYVKSVSGSNIVDEKVDSTAGTYTFRPISTGGTISVNSNQHGNFEVRAKDLINDAFLFDDQDASATNYETTDGVIFNGTAVGDNGITIASGGELRVRLYARATQIDENANDYAGTYILIDADTTVWNDQKSVLKIDDADAPEVSGSLTASEKAAYNSYEFVYKIQGNRDIVQNNEVLIDYSLFALSGQNPTGAHNVSIDFAPIGKYPATLNSDNLNTGSVDDSTSRTDIHTRFDTVFAIA